MGFIPKLEKVEVKAIMHDPSWKGKVTWAYEVAGHSKHQKRLKGELTHPLSSSPTRLRLFLSLEDHHFPLSLSSSPPKLPKVEP